MSIPAELEHLAVDIDGLSPYPQNAREGSIPSIVESLETNGQYRPIVVNKRTMQVLAGNHTLKAAQQLGWRKIAATFVDVDEAGAKRIVLVDNRTNDLAGYDEEALAELLVELEGDYQGTGFDQESVDELLSSLEIGYGRAKNEDWEPAVPDEPTTQPGDIYELGDHRLICGDSSDRDVYERLLGDERVRLIVTSPPYNQQIDKFKPSGMQKENPAWVERMASAYEDSKPEAEYQAEQIEVMNLWSEWVTDDGALFYNHKNRYRDKAVVSPLTWILKTTWRLRQEIIWNRSSSITLNARMFMPVDERVYWMTKTGKFTFHDTSDNKALSTVWEIAPRAEAGVSAPFPVELPRRAIEACTDRDDLVLDPYAGSGTVLVAAQSIGRASRLVELNPAYCDVIVARWEALTGKEAVLHRED